LQRLFALAFLLALPISSAAQLSAQTGARELSLEQQTKIAETITREAGPPLPGAHFSLAIGNAVPSNIQLRPVPTTVVQVAPQFRDASYVVVEEQIAIVDSRSRKILDVVQRGLSQTGSVPAQKP
jgi:Protein of unknown function (DUF1236)